MEVLAREGDGEVGQQIKPKSQGRGKSFFITSAIAEQLQRFVTVGPAKMSRVQAQ